MQREKSIKEGKKRLAMFRDLLDIIEEDLLSGIVNEEIDALIAIKAIDAFFREEEGLASWSFKVKDLVQQQLTRSACDA